MTVNFQHGRTLISTKLFAVAYIALLAAMAGVGYLGYLSVVKLQTDQNIVQSKYDDLSTRYSGLQADYGELLKNNSNMESQLAGLRSQFAMLQSQQNTLQSKYSALQADYTKFVADYQKLRPINPFSYTVFTDGKGNYYAQNGTTNAIDYSGTDLAPILNAVIAPEKTCYFLPGIYRLRSSVNIFGKNGTSICGAGVEATVIEVASDVCAFNITGASSSKHNSGFSMSNLAINSTASSTKPAIFMKYMNDVKLDDLSVARFSVGYDIECTEKVYVHRCKVWGEAATFSVGFKFVGYSIDTFLTDTIVLHNQPKGMGYFFDSCDSVILTNVVANPTVRSYGSGGYGFLFAACHWVNLIGTVSDGNGGHGYYLSGGFRYYFTGAWAGSNYGNGLQSDGAGQIIFSGCSFYSNRMDGIKLSNSNGTSISTTISRGNCRHGLEVSNTDGITVTASILTQNGINGIFLNGGNSYAIIQNNNCMDNSDPSFDIHISTLHSGSSYLVSNNLGRTNLET